MWPSATGSSSSVDTTLEWDSVEGFADYFVDRFGPLVTARQMLGDGSRTCAADIVTIWERRNAADDGSFRLAQEYLVSVVSF